MTVPVQSFLVNNKNTKNCLRIDFCTHMNEVDETDGESTKIDDNRSGSMREGSGSPKNALKIKTQVHKQKNRNTQKHRKTYFKYKIL